MYWGPRREEPALCSGSRGTARRPRSSSARRAREPPLQLPPPPPAGIRHRGAALRAKLPGERGSTHGQAAPAGCPPPPPAPGPLPSTLVRVRTGLLQALSGATRAECFFMMSRPPAGAPPPIAYILGPAGARLSGPVPVASAAEERERLAAQALPPGLPAGLLSPARLTAAAAPPSTSSLAAQPLHTRAHSLLPGGCCKLQRHVQVRSPRPPHGLTCSAPRPGTPGPPQQQPGPSLPALSRAVASCGAGHQLPGLPFATTRSLAGGDTRELSLEFKMRGV